MRSSASMMILSNIRITKCFTVYHKTVLPKTATSFQLQQQRSRTTLIHTNTISYHNTKCTYNGITPIFHCTVAAVAALNNGNQQYRYYSSVMKHNSHKSRKTASSSSSKTKQDIKEQEEEDEEQERLRIEREYFEEEERKRKEEESFHELVKQMIAKAEIENVQIDTLEVPAPKSRDYESLSDYIKAWYHYVIYEIKWRAKDIYYEYTVSLPYPPGYEPPTTKRTPIKYYPWIFKMAVKTLYEDWKYTLGLGPPPVDLYGQDAVKEYEEKQRLKQLEKQGWIEHEEEEPVIVEATGKTEVKKVKKLTKKKTIVDTFNESESGNEFIANLVKSRFLLVRNCMNQFIVGYNEGMGREIDRDALLRRKQLLAEPVKLNQETIMQKVGTVAQSLRKFTDDVKEMTVVEEKDLNMVNAEEEKTTDTEKKKQNKKSKTKSSSKTKKHVTHK